jgi:hypothetical protein
MLEVLNILFFVFHSLLMVFNLMGWLIPRLRRVHLFTIGLTAFSWFVLGWWYGWGYCFCTDWHWQVRQALGLPNPSHSYIHFLMVQLSPWNPAPVWADAAALLGFFIGMCGSLWVNLIKKRPGQKN